MHGRFASRIEEGLDSLARRIEKSKRALDRGVLERQIGRLLKSIRVPWPLRDRDYRSKAVPARLRLKWSARAEWDDWASVSEGTYILRSNIHEWSDEELRKTYVQLSEAEAAFRIQKSDLSSARSGTTRKSASKRTSWSASSLTRCGRRCSNGNRAPASVMHRVTS